MDGWCLCGRMVDLQRKAPIVAPRRAGTSEGPHLTIQSLITSSSPPPAHYLGPLDRESPQGHTSLHTLLVLGGFMEGTPICPAEHMVLSAGCNPDASTPLGLPHHCEQVTKVYQALLSIHRENRGLGPGVCPPEKEQPRTTK